MTTLIDIVIAILHALLPALKQAAQDSAEDGARATELKTRLQQRVQSSWGKGAKLLLLSLVLWAMTGCFTRTIYVPDGTPVRLRETIRAAKIWALDKDGNPVPGRMDLPEGWYALPDPGKK